ncbi:MAG: hypothetical protein ABEJ76_04875 [Halanaeroarchaeum sp.]
MDLTTWIDVADGISFVGALVCNRAPEPRRFRLANRLDGPAWPPRVHGIPAAGWDDDGFEGVVASGATLALGYASPAEPPDDAAPATVAWTEPAGESEAHPTARAAVRRRGDPRPPADVVVPPHLRDREEP